MKHPVLVGFALTLLVLACPGEVLVNTPAEAAEGPVLTWHRPVNWGIEGRAFPESERLRWYDRFPASAQGRVTNSVWNLSRDSAGMMVRFRTDAATIWADYALQRAHQPGVNMTGIASGGLDLYARDENGRWRWVGVTRPSEQVVRQEIVSGLAPGEREYALYLPLRNGVENLAIGVPEGATFTGLPPREEKPIVFYGTSINHGASASRPGMTHIAMLGRRLNRPVMNFGFAGNGRMDAEVGEYLVQIDAAMFVIDCLPNMGPTGVREKCPPLVRQLRAAHPETPIVLVEDRRNTNAWILPARDAFHTANHAALRECFEALQREGVTGLHYIAGDDLLGDDSDGTTDGSHPSDLGFYRQAAVFEPVLRAILGQ